MEIVENTAAAGQPARSWIDRALAALPLIGLAIVTLTFYGYEAWLRKTPWLFADEDEWAQISRAIASTGQISRSDFNGKCSPRGPTISNLYRSPGMAWGTNSSQ